jgi:hypothetical protein
LIQGSQREADCDIHRGMIETYPAKILVIKPQIPIQSGQFWPIPLRLLAQRRTTALVNRKNQ